MPHGTPSPLVVAVRVYPEPKESGQGFDEPKRDRELRNAMFVFGTETRIHHTQRLTFGSYRFVADGQVASDKLFYADDLSTNDCRVLEKYVADAKESRPRLVLLTRAQFVDSLFKNAYKGRCLLVAFNFPFDISRVALNATNARRRFTGGFFPTLLIMFVGWDQNCASPH